ncbi:hypothetical protein H8356DRAFT_1025370 [Neocallimastix lanati (nom. inval.)]|jgi:hypothetical protein|uniref:Sphingomyelin synthase-like domain-containing protein n=1 Tax=Neocallimastix californiae TaxID=1754190 RepID=A0A1Y2DMB7_9FUNG|nr:hypothetical protein H8356DRAFT_1025370 [Neocallimastix sp. JGI-2020a]ORY59815.1 hypothetical protein LY90DRAFT_668783 [Neocallimastix californiae]|eukprot:ORY59815.1 hypothetical protein LY90DRAFT_668783 [Neocallimastix californiae]
MGDIIQSEETKTWIEKIKPYLKIYRNNRDIIFTFYAAVWFFICTYIVSLANSYADRINTNVNKIYDQPYVAPDVILQPSNAFFEKNLWIPRSIADYIVRTSAALIIIRALTLKSYSLTVTRRILLIMGFVYLLRACFIPLTVLPTPWLNCKKTYKENIFYDALLIVLQVRAACGDVFFSGHTIMFTLNIVEYWYYCKRTWINVLVTIMNVIGMYSLIMASYHYSIDVLCAFIFSLMFWAIYHWAISIPELGSTWWGDIINYIDDPFFYEHAELPIAYERNNGINNVADIAELLSNDKYEESDNGKSEVSNENVAINEIALLYELSREKQKKNMRNMDNNGETDSSEEENIYTRKSVISNSISDNISNLNASPSINSIIDIQPEFSEELNRVIVKKDKYLSPNYGNKAYKHHSLNSLLSNSDKSGISVPSVILRSSNTNLSVSNVSTGYSSASLSPAKSIGENSILAKSSQNFNQKVRYGKHINTNSSLNSSSSNSDSSYTLNNITIQGKKSLTNENLTKESGLYYSSSSSSNSGITKK